MASKDGSEAKGGAAGVGSSTHFNFSHPVFRLSGCRFVVSDDGKASVILPLGDLNGLISIPALKKEFSLDGTPDDGLLNQIEASLPYVKTIYPGDSIPREILDGTASWAVKEHHLRIANGRLTVQLSSWFTGREEVILDRSQLLELTDTAEVKARVNEAIGEIASRLGLPHERRGEVMSRIEVASRELAYIEALRDRFGSIANIRTSLQDFIIIYRRDRSFSAELHRIDVLIRKPIEEFSSRFDQVDAQCGEIVGLLRNLEAQIAFIRASRDDLHIRMMPWDPIIETWADLPRTSSPEIELKIRDLYKFLANRYSLARSWKLSNQIAPPR